MKSLLFKGLKPPLWGNFVEFYPKPSKSRNFGPKVGKPQKVGDLTPVYVVIQYVSVSSLYPIQVDPLNPLLKFAEILR